MKYLVVGAYNLIVVAGTAYIVFWLGHSGWWFLLTVLLMVSVTRNE